MSMPWSLAKAKEARILADPAEQKRLTALFDACFRIQREANEAAGRYIPLVVENVKGAQKWVGRARWNFGSFYLWGDVPALMPLAYRVAKVPGQDWNKFKETGEVSPHWRMEAIKNGGGSWFNIGSPGQKVTNKNPVHALTAEGIKNKDVAGYKRDHPAAFGWKKPRTSSHSKARKAASALIAKIPLALSQHIARVWKPGGFAV